MTLPRQNVPGTTYLVTRRCSERRFFLWPSRRTDETHRYVLAIAARRHGIRVHAYCVLSNHFQLVVTDPDAKLPLDATQGPAPPLDVARQALPAVVDDGEREAEQELDDWLAETVVEAEQEAHVGERDPEDRVGAGRVEYRRWTASSSR